jgi:DNA-damage-inducible protein J
MRNTAQSEKFSKKITSLDTQRRLNIIPVYKQEGKHVARTAMSLARLAPEVKREAENNLKELGISIHSAHRMFYRQIIAHKGLPFDVRIPTAETVKAIEDARHGKGRRYAT